MIEAYVSLQAKIVQSLAPERRVGHASFQYRPPSLVEELEGCILSLNCAPRRGLPVDITVAFVCPDGMEYNVLITLSTSDQPQINPINHWSVLTLLGGSWILARPIFSHNIRRMDKGAPNMDITRTLCVVDSGDLELSEDDSPV